MTDSSPTPPNRQDPPLDPADDSDEPAFEWMQPKPADQRPQAGSRADRKAAEAAVVQEPAAGSAGASDSALASDSAATSGSTPYKEPLPTSALQVRPPEEEVQRRNAERELAAKAKPVAPRVMQVLLAVCFPVILLVLAVRAVASPLFLWVEYNRPGFPGDGYGFSADDRMTYGSYAVDYLGNWAGPRYLGELVNRSGDPLFGNGEVSHMADVKVVILSAYGAGALLILLSIIAVIYLRRRTPGGVRRGLFAGSVIALTVILGLGVLAALGWEQFFAQFHSIFFASGTWTFALQDTLIRLFPGQFWVDGGITVAGLVLVASLVTLILTWPTRKRRGLPKRGAAATGAAAADPADTDPAATDAAAGDAADGDTADRVPPGTAEADVDGAAPAKRSRFRRDRSGTSGATTDGDTDASGAADSGTPGTPARGHSSTV